MNAPLVAIVGRPNVGKSTLFNRLVGARQAIVEDQPGVTRDRLYGVAQWEGRNFLVVDTGGLDPSLETGIPAHIRVQAEVAIEEADLLLFVIEAQLGPTADDHEIAELLRRSGATGTMTRPPSAVTRALNASGSLTSTYGSQLGCTSTTSLGSWKRPAPPRAFFRTWYSTPSRESEIAGSYPASRL